MPPARPAFRRPAFPWYLAALLVLVSGAALAAQRFPGGFDWAYTVVSALASRKHNPAGHQWFAGALALSMVLLLSAVSTVRADLFRVFPDTTRWVRMLQVGLVGGALVGLERLIFHHLSDLVHKAHEILALLSFLCLYTGILGLLFQFASRSRSLVPLAILVASPLALIGITQLYLYFDQRDLGWVDAGWRDLGIPLYLSFAFWQWSAMVFLLLGLGVVLLVRHAQDPE